MQLIPPPWLFVLTGVLFNILSAVITHTLIGLNNDRIGTIDREIGNRQVLIESLWHSRVEVERKKEFFLLLLSGNAGDQPPIVEIYRNYLLGLIDSHGLDGFREAVGTVTTDDARLLLDISDAALGALIEHINDTYLEILDRQEQRTPLERANSRWYSIAIFLQVTGLILVLARDLRRS